MPQALSVPQDTVFDTVEPAEVSVGDTTHVAPGAELYEDLTDEEMAYENHVRRSLLSILCKSAILTLEELLEDGQITPEQALEAVDQRLSMVSQVDTYTLLNYVLLSLPDEDFHEA